MNPDPLEAELRKLQPRAASDALRSAVASELRVPAATSRVVRKKHPQVNWLRWGWALAGTMAIALVVSLQSIEKTHRPSTAATPLGNARIVSYTLRDARDDGMFFDAQGQPLRQVRYLGDETMRWQSAQTGARLQISYPREETMIIPVSGN